jgi:hypothetical protein
MVDGKDMIYSPCNATKRELITEVSERSSTIFRIPCEHLQSEEELCKSTTRRSNYFKSVGPAMTFTPRPTPDSSSHATSQSGAVKVRVYKICTGKVFDPIARIMSPRQVVWVDRESGIVVRVGEGDEQLEEETFGSEFEMEVTDVDLTNLPPLSYELHQTPMESDGI